MLLDRVYMRISVLCDVMPLLMITFMCNGFSSIRNEHQNISKDVKWKLYSKPEYTHEIL
jgi:hypothetical protein